MTKVWFVTGSSRGLGRSFVEAALSRGDQVAATARHPQTLHDLAELHGDAVLPLPLDVTDRTAVTAAVNAAHEHFGRLDVIVNNAGYGLFGMIEELTEQQLRAQMETNFFGAFWATQAVLPLMRAQGQGHIIQISSVNGITAFPFIGGYNASKWALEGFSESLAQEVQGLGIKVTLVEPGSFDTDWVDSSAVQATPNPAYKQLHTALEALRDTRQPADPAAAGRALLQIVDAEQPPLRVLFGSQPVDIVKGLYAQRLQTWADWEHVSRAAQG
ncbi:SDR family NAD(P)-dependent oxidoreductase [Streptomyces sp. KM273126]|uniref:SDR family NAD(P)-dependent oxidoreductase n=1 Tax=Streptomyces sp. KM273126 TaxID=2545247 RepID=UPI00103CA21B|nr:SDR family NAD(P)-dependent oxidoreductase [Streptomyces sp. KM273126]MBA2813305.1 SDR family NAD(P)-dependent oxidoreductase [Streptomyces sp. KM273126]